MSKIERLEIPVNHKPFKGYIHSWEKIYFNKDEHPYAKDSLGYVIYGYPTHHPDFSNWIRTSAVVKHEDNVIETLNSKYHLVGEENKK